MVFVNSGGKPMKMLSNDDVAKIITVPECITIIEKLFQNLDVTHMPPKVYMDVPNGDFRSMPAVVHETAGIKWAGIQFDNTGKCKIFAKVLINDIPTGELLAILDGEELTAIRTAAVTGVATKYLAKQNSKIATFIGCGTQTPKQIQAIMSVRNLDELRLFDLDKKRSQALAKQFENHIRVAIFDDLKDALKDSDIVTTLTPSKTGFIHNDMLMPGCLVNAIGADAAGKRELDISVLSHAGMIVYDEWEQCSHSGEIQYLSEADRRATLFSLGEIVSHSNWGYTNDDRMMTTVFDATGLAIEDVATARYILEKVVIS